MWKKISEFINNNEDEYDEFYYSITKLNDRVEYLGDHKQSKNAAIIRLLFSIGIALPIAWAGMSAHVATWAVATLLALSGASAIECFISLGKYMFNYLSAIHHAKIATKLKIVLDEKERQFKIDLIKSISKQDCKVQGLNSIKSRLIDLEQKKVELSKQDEVYVADLKIDNEIELTQYLLDSANRLAPYADEDETNDNLILKTAQRLNDNIVDKKQENIAINSKEDSNEHTL